MKKRSLFSNSVVMIVTQAWGMILTLVITPQLYRSLGSEGYGLFSLVLVLANYMTIVDFGFGWAIIKFVAQFAAKKDFQTMERVIRVSVWTTLVLGCLMGLGLAVAAPWLAGSVFNVPTERVATVSAGITMCGAIAVLMLVSGLLSGVLKGLQRFDLAVGISSLSTTVRMIGYALLLRAGYGLLSMWVLTLIAALAAVVAYRVCMRRLLPDVRLWPTFDRAAFKMIFSFGAFSFGTRLLTMPYFYLDKLFISALLPVAALAQYVIPFNLAQKTTGTGGLIVSVLFPSVSERAHDRKSLLRLYQRTVPMIYSLILPMVLVAVTIGPRFLTHWIDANFGEIARLPLMLMATGFGAVTLGSVDGTFVEGVGKPKIRTAIYATLSVISLPLCYALTRKFGIVGTAATICFAFSAGGVLEVISCQMVVMKNWWYMKRILPAVVACSVMAMAIGWAGRMFASGLWSTIAVGLAMYLALALATARMVGADRQLIEYYRTS